MEHSFSNLRLVFDFWYMLHNAQFYVNTKGFANNKHFFEFMKCKTSLTAYVPKNHKFTSEGTALIST